MIPDYNATKGGGVCVDKVTGSYSTKRMTALWPLVFFYNMIDLSVCNTFVIGMEIFPEWDVSKLYKRCIFLEELGKALVVAHIQRRQHMLHKNLSCCGYSEGGLGKDFTVYTSV